MRLLRDEKNGTKITFLTSYDYPTATFAEKAGMDMLLVKGVEREVVENIHFSNLDSRL